MTVRAAATASLPTALDPIATAGRGVLLHLRGHQRRGSGLPPELAAHRRQDAGTGTVDANLDLGLPVDARDYAAAADALVDLGIHHVRLLTNDPAEMAGLRGCGVSVTERVPMRVHRTDDNLRHLTTKRDRTGHHPPGLPGPWLAPSQAV